jgi:glycosyltransferase involved in cell wall biosynthesis
MHALADRYIAVSDPGATAFRTHGRLRQTEFNVVPSCAEAAPAAARRPPFLPPGPFLLFVGALGAHKGLDVLIDAYRSLEREIPLVLIGTRRHDTPRSFPRGVVVVQDVKHEDLLAAWRHALIGVAPSICVEGFGIAAAEAMAAGRPVVASALGGLCDIVADQKTGILCPPGNPRRLREAVRQLIDDDAARERMGEATRLRAAAMFSLGCVADEVEAIYDSLVGEEPAAMPTTAAAR